MKVTVKQPDFKKAVLDLEKIEKNKLEEIEREVREAADQAVLLMKTSSPINEGRLRGSISAEDETPYLYNIAAQSKYAAYMEFGTRTLVSIPPGAEEIAAQARNQKGGTLADMEKSIRRWVRLKGIAGTYSVKTRRRTGGKALRQAQDDSVVFLIMRKLLKVGVKPQPFFYPAIQRVAPGFVKKLTEIITR